MIDPETCPTCGGAVVVASSSEGTSHYIPAVSPDAWERLTQERDAALDALRLIDSGGVVDVWAARVARDALAGR